MTDPSHLRNPLNGIVGLTNLLLESALQSEQRDLVRMIQSAAEEMLAGLGGGGLRLLLAEDDPANQIVDQTLLARLGHTVDAVSNGQQVLQRLGETRYDAVILDCQMPVMDGFETASRIRSSKVAGADPQIPIIALTAYTTRSARDRCLAAGMNECLTKPLNSAEMASALARARTAPPPPARPARPAASHVLDRGQLDAMRAAPGKTRANLLAEFVALFYRDEPRRIRELRAVAGRRDPGDLARLAHSVAGSCAMLGARELQQAALALERAAAADSWADVPGRLDAVELSWQRLREALADEGFPLSE